MSELPVQDVVHTGEGAAVVVPLAEYRRLRELEERMADSEDEAALREYQQRKTAGTAELVPHEEVKRKLGLPST
ncbi:MAG: hypothetical protein JOY82_03140 [Streptosporangiaceae bacterium]|nr:hypothetical protein [Streptosporangiaceae bacterium]MBV9853507.1 hypothetical protein [Streptosporangiaceae bacterium]